MADNNSKLFREKSMAAIESPESMNDYLRVTSPKSWLTAAGVILILAGVTIWSILGSIETSVQVTVLSNPDGIVCYLPESAMKAVMEGEDVAVNGETLNLRTGAVESQLVTEETNVLVRLNEGLNYGDTVYAVPAEGTLEAGSYTGTIKTEKLKPISLLFN